MRNRIAVTMILLILSLFFALPIVYGDQAILGTWEGTLEASGAKLKVVFNISKTPEGTFTATMDSPDQGAMGIPVDSVMFDYGHLVLDVKSVMGSFDGNLKQDKSEIEGTWKQGGMSLPLVLKRSEGVSETKKTEEPKAVPSPGKEGIEGMWLGTLSFSGMDLRVVFHISKNPEGTLSATMDSPDQGAKDISVEEATFQNNHLRLDAKSIGGVYEGDLKTDKPQLDGNWTQGGTTIPLVLEKTDKVPELNRPQEPKPPFPYEAREVSYENKQAGITLAGTLTLPKTGAPFPAVLLITGSGAEDRDETVLGHRPFLVLADYLTRRGIAVLRVDDRGVGKSTGSTAKATSEDFAQDALAGVEYLKSLKEINPKQIGLIGHSEGGIIAPLVAEKSPDVAFIVMMAGTGVTGEQILYLQSALIYKAEGVSDETIAKDRKLKEQIFAVIKQESDSAAAAKKMRQLMDDAMAQMEEKEKQALSYSPDMVDMSIQQLLVPWFRYFLTFDPKPTLMKVKCPVLAINGEKDLQVPPKENLPAIEEALKAGGNPDITVKELPGLNHLFQTAETGSPMEYSKIEETISPDALDTIGNWIKEHTKEKK
ncbi:MAG TPA: alpha/beta hydrolase [candidate division Zixibacteria bacterium]